MPLVVPVSYIILDMSVHRCTFYELFYVFGKAIAWFGEGHELGVINAQCGEDRWQDAQIPQIDRC